MHSRFETDNAIEPSEKIIMRINLTSWLSNRPLSRGSLCRFSHPGRLCALWATQRVGVLFTTEASPTPVFCIKETDILKIQITRDYPTLIWDLNFITIFKSQWPLWLNMVKLLMPLMLLMLIVTIAPQGLKSMASWVRLMTDTKLEASQVLYPTSLSHLPVRLCVQTWSRFQIDSIKITINQYRGSCCQLRKHWISHR